MKASLLLVVLFVGVALCHSEDEARFNSYIDEDPVFKRIVSKYYQKFLKGLPPGKRDMIAENSQKAKPLEYNCIHDKILEKQNELYNPVSKRAPITEEKKSNEKRAIGPIRFMLEDDLLQGTTDPRACHTIGSIVTDPGCIGSCQVVCQSKDLLDNELRNLLTNVAQAILEFFENTLSIEQTVGNLVLDAETWNDFGRVCFPDIPISSSLTTTGVAGYDMIVYFAARPVAETGTVAYALTCNYKQLPEGRKGRPLAGHVNFVPEQFVDYKSGVDEFKFAGAVKVGLHEFTHALGFSSNYYKSFFDKRTGDFYASTTVVTCATETLPIARITTPRVVEVARSHYGCPSLNGVQLEEFGGAGTSGSHWDRRVVGDEYMAGYINPVMPVSYLTLAFFEDMGFYTANFSRAEFWAWGKDQGCAWVNNRCEDSWVGKPGYFCTSASLTGCSADRKGKAKCNVRTYNFDLNSYYRHFPDPSIGGSDAAADYCPYFNIPDNTDYCVNAGNIALGTEAYGPDSRCWEYNNVINEKATACWNHKCNETGLFLIISGVSHLCPAAGGLIPGIGPNNNGVFCPPTSLLCRIPLPPVGNLTTDSAVPQAKKECEAGSASCFIATAAYGSPSEEHVWALRQFRDNYLIQTSLGREFVSWYYRVSPPIADWISQSEVARLVVRSLLAPLVAFVRLF